MIEIKECRSYKEKRNFINFPLRLYKNSPYFVPPLYIDEKKIFKKNYYYNKSSKSIFINAYKDGKQVGRLQGMINFLSNEKWKQKRVRFTRFDTINDFECVKTMFDYVVNWAKKEGMTEICGPLGYSDFEREGLLIEGFDQFSTFEEQYNYDYYPQLIEQYGFKKEIDWEERKLFPPKEIDPRFYNIVESIKQKHHFKVLKFKTINQIVKEYGDQFFKLAEETYSKLYQTVPFLEEQKKDIVKSFKLVLKADYVCLVVDEHNKLVSLGLCFPSIGKALQKSGGKLTIPTILKLFNVLKETDVLELGLIGVDFKYRNTGVAFIVVLEMMKIIISKKIKYCETNLNLETNKDILNCWKRFPNILHKKRRAYLKKL